MHEISIHMIADYEILLFYGHSFPEVKTQQVLWGFLSVYPELVALIGIIRACSSGDTEDRQAITMAR